jgi:hypothetical protein
VNLGIQMLTAVQDAAGHTVGGKTSNDVPRAMAPLVYWIKRTWF